MKIVILVSMYPPVHIGGAEIVAQNIAKHLSLRGHDVFVVTSQDRGFPLQQREEEFLVNRIYYPKIKYIGTMIFWIKCLFLIKKINPDIVYCKTIQMGVPGFLFKKFYKKPYIVWCQGDDIYFPWPFKKYISRIVLNLADAVVAQTNNMKQELHKNYIKNIFVLPNGIDLEKFHGFSKWAVREEFKIPLDEKIIIFVGGLKSIKGVAYLIEAFKTISQTFPKARLLLVGDGQERHNLEELVKKHSLQEKVHFLGQIENANIPKYMSLADIFVLPSLFEMFGVVNLEAMASGLPIVATRVYGVPEVVEDGQNGFLVDSKSPEQLAEKMLLLFENDQLREEISENNKEKAKKYSWEHIIEKLEKIYSEVIYKNKN